MDSERDFVLLGESVPQVWVLTRTFALWDFSTLRSTFSMIFPTCLPKSCPKLVAMLWVNYNLELLVPNYRRKIKKTAILRECLFGEMREWKHNRFFSQPPAPSKQKEALRRNGRAKTLSFSQITGSESSKNYTSSKLGNVIYRSFWGCLGWVSI